MSISGDIDTLRSQGASDTDILKAYRAMSPQNASDVDTLMKQGADPGDILKAAVHSDANQSGDTPSPYENTWSGTGQHLLDAEQYGAANALVGTGKSIQQLPGQTAADAGHALIDYGQNFSNPKYQPSTFKASDLTDPNQTWGGVGSKAGWKLAEAFPGLAASLALKSVPGVGTAAAIGSEVAQHYGVNAENRQANDSAPMTGLEKAGLLATTAGEGALGMTGLGRAGSTLAKGVGAGVGLPALKTVAQVPLAIGENAGLSAAGDALNQESRSAFTSKNPGLVNPLNSEMADAASLGGIAGGAVRAARVPGEALTSSRMSGFAGDNANYSNSYADRMNNIPKLGWSPKDVNTRMTLADQGVHRDLGNAMGASKDFFESNPQAKDMVDGLKDQVGQGIPLTPEQSASLGKTLGDTGAPAQVGFHLNELSRGAALKGMGTSGPGTFESGLAGGPIGGIVSPTKTIGGLIAHGAAGSVGALAVLHTLGEVGGIGHALPWIAAGQIAANRAVKGIDALSGYGNIAKQFATRFGGKGPTNIPPTPLPENTDANMQLPPAVRAQIMANQYKAKQMQDFMGQKGPVGLPENPSFEATQAQTPGEQQAQSFQGFMPKGGNNGLPEALGFEGSASPEAPPPDVQGTGPLNNKALAQIALNKMNRANTGADAQSGENAQLQALVHLATLRKQGMAMMNQLPPDQAPGTAILPETQGQPVSRDGFGGQGQVQGGLTNKAMAQIALNKMAALKIAQAQAAAKAQGSPQVPPQAPQAPMAPPPAPMVPQAAPGPSLGTFATKARIKQVPMAPPEAANPGAIPETQAPVPNSIKVNGDAPARPAMSGVAQKAMAELYARINANKYTPDRLEKTPGVDPEQGDFVINHAGLTATRDSASIDHPDAYKGAVVKNLDVRGNFRDELKGVLPESAGKDVDKLAQLLTNQHVTRVKAEAMIIDLMTAHSGEKHGPAFDKVLMKHIKGLMGTYGQ